MKECRNCKSFKPSIHPLHRGDPNREMILEGLCQKEQQTHDFDDFCDKFEENEQKSQ
jgi:hypothetical protein